MIHTWLALLSSRPDDADAAAAFGAGGEWLAAWRSQAKPVREALRIDSRMIDPDGPAATVSLVLPPRTLRIVFDDGAVQQARRALLASEPFDAVTTLMRDDSAFCGSLLVARGEGAAQRLASDPFARVAAARIDDVGAGLLAERVPWPAGPVIERYGSANPWPLDHF